MRTSFRAALALCLAAGATTAGAAPEVEITVAAYQNVEKAVRAALPLWEKHHPEIKVNLVTRPFGEHHRRMQDAFESGEDVPDALAVEVGFVHLFAEGKGWLTDLGAAPYGARPLLAQSLPYTVPEASAGTDMVAAVPAGVGPGTLLYRKDLLDRAGVTEEELTRSWASYLEAGKKLKAATGAFLLPSVQDLVDLAVRSGLGEGEGTYFDVQGRPLLGTPRFEQAFELARQAREAGLDARVDLWTSGWADGLKKGTIATQPVGAWLVPHLDAWLAPGTRGLWRAAQLPGGAFANLGGDLYAIPAKAAHKAEAWQFIQFLCFDREAQLAALRAADAWPALLAAQDDPVVDQPIPFLGGQKARRLWKVAAARVPVTPVHRHDALAAEVVRRTLARVLEKNENARWALADAQGRLERALAEEAGQKAGASGAGAAPGTIELRVAVFANLDGSLKAALPLWEKRHPEIKVKLESRPFGDHHVKGLESRFASADVVGIEAGWMHGVAAANVLEDLSEPRYGARELVAQVLGSALPPATPGGAIAAIPADVGPGTLFYRKDVLDRAGLAEADLTGSWDAFLEAGKKLKAATGAALVADASIVKDIVIRNGLADGEGIFFDARGQPLVDSPRFEEAFTLAKRIRDDGLDARTEQWSKAWVDGLTKGTIATQPIGSWFVWHLNEWLAPRTKGAWRAAQLPGGAYASWGGSYWAIPKLGAHKKQAWELVRFLCFDVDAQAAALRAVEAWPALRAAQDGPLVDAPVAFLGDQKARQLWKVAAAHVPAIPLDPRDASAGKIVQEELTAVLEHGKAIKQALADARQRVAALAP